MAKGPTTVKLSSGYYSTETLAANFQAIETAFQNTLSRDGSTPNAMAGDIDMDGHDILNVGQMDIATLIVNNVDYRTFTSDRAAELNGLTLAKGDLLYFNGTALARLPIGTTGQQLEVLVDVPSWQDQPTLEVQEDGVAIETATYVIDFQTGGRPCITTDGAGKVTVNLDTFVTQV